MVTKWEYTDLWWFVEHTSDRGAMPQVDGDTSQSELLNELGVHGRGLVSRILQAAYPNVMGSRIPSRFAST